MVIPMTYADNLKGKMRDKEVTQSQLSELTGIGKSSISQYMSGRNEPRDPVKQIINDVLDALPGDYSETMAVDEGEILNVPIATAAKKLGTSEQFVRMGLQEGIFDFGYAVKLSSRFTYHISPKKLSEYVGQ